MNDLGFWSDVDDMCRIDMDSILEYDISSFILQAILDSSKDGLIVTDENLLIKKVNIAAVKILGIKEDTLYETFLTEILKEDILNTIMLTGEKHIDEDLNFFVNGTRIRCVTNIIPVRIRGKNIGLVLSLRDTKNLHKMVNNVVGYKASFTFDDIITKDEGMRSAIELAKKAARTNCNILIEGESGTGKEVFAQSIHNYSSRADGPFVAINCAAIPRELVESELFGYEKGAFTGASKGGNPGKFELADGGTIFLDEIGELPLDIQSKLLRVLDNLKISRVGGTYEKSIDVRVIAATNRVLTNEIENKNFRGDLYYRLNVMNIALIPLEKRNEDIELFAQNFVSKLNAKKPSDPKYIDPSYIESLKKQSFQGNIRELRNVVERSYYLCEGNLITSKHLQNKARQSNITDIVSPTKEILPLETVEEQCIRDALAHCKGNAIKAANLLKIGKATIYRKLAKFNIDIDEFS
ncbi:sigma-54 interaction domain-containing protein [Clostridium magnum]|uniref:Limonene hydroxylase n=1 Tax=Clostridium magnum DSM 2767 TaxID=1121326 RepID=A0A162UF16_9CLOT|nr:sigma 54-interacting transcriptional regulator [Clostridium magnum]KZL93833.1 limonene hydroxylase [Clostridium magnum DSM 2767]SHI08093.1 PAS domain S-box-containing protein [Clostridium magnum DSM 2767]